MPIYEYECKSCGVYEVNQKITEPALETCGTCGKEVRRLISATSFALKGGGWYADGYASTGGAANGDAGGKKDGGGSCSGGSCATGS